jgi:hypothetical protein
MLAMWLHQNYAVVVDENGETRAELDGEDVI